MRKTLLITVIVLVAMALVAPAAMAKKKKKKGGEPPPPEPATWFDYHGVQCYQPPDIAAEPSKPEKRMMRQKAMEEILKLMRGEINEQFVVEERKIDSWETDFLGKPTGLDGFLVENVTRCKAFADGDISLTDYRTWLEGSGKRATAGDCHNPLAYELHQNISVQDGWQIRRHMCESDQVLIETTATNKYTIEDTGDYDTTLWLSPEGDPARPEAGEGFPCPHCPAGAVVYRFEFEDGREPEFGVLGSSKEFKAPGNGYVSFTVNDFSYFDNTFHEQNGIIDYLPLSIYPPVQGIDDPE